MMMRRTKCAYYCAIGKKMLSQDVFSSLAQRPRGIRRRELPTGTSVVRVLACSELPKRYLSSSVLRIDMLYRLHETFFFRDLTLRNMAQELISSGKMSLQEKLDKIRSPKLQNQHQVCSFSPNLHRVPLTRARLPLCCLRSKIP